MSKRQKRLQKIRQNPKAVSFDQLRQVLEDYGILLHRTEGSHHHFKYNLGGETKLISIPFARPIKVIYVRTALKIIDQIIAESGEQESDE